MGTRFGCCPLYLRYVRALFDKRVHFTAKSFMEVWQPNWIIMELQLERPVTVDIGYLDVRRYRPFRSNPNQCSVGDNRRYKGILSERDFMRRIC